MKNWKTTAEAILTSGPVVPVIVVKKLEHAVPMAKALVAGGVRVLEVTLRTECAMDAIRAIAKEVPEAIVGAGTVTNVEQLKEVTEAGAQFAISPGLTESLLKAATGEGTRRRESAAGDWRPVRAHSLLPDWRHLSGELSRLSGAEQRTVHRRLLAGAGGCAGSR